MEANTTIGKPLENDSLVGGNTRLPAAANKSGQFVFLAASALLLLFGIFCAAKIVILILTVGGNNLSDDYLGVIDTVDSALSGKLKLGNYLSSVFSGQHLLAFPVLVHIGMARFFEWNARIELLVEAAINLVRALMLCDLLTASLGKKFRPLMLGMMLCLVFSLSQASVHLFGQSGIPVALSLFGFVFGLWGLLKFNRQELALGAMLLGGIISAGSMGNVIPCWITYLIAMVAIGHRSLFALGTWSIGFGTCIAPYAYFLSSRGMSIPSQHNAINWMLFFDLVGRPFANKIGIFAGPLPMAEGAGAFAIVASLASVIVCLRNRQWNQSTIACMMLMAYGFMTSAMLGLVRAVVAPWYAPYAMCIWMGLVGFFTAAIFETGEQQKDVRLPGDERPGANLSSLVVKALAFVLLAGTAVLYVLSNRTYGDKQTYLLARSPVSESALRHYRTGPTYLEHYLFQWANGRPSDIIKLAAPLERHRISAFSSRQEWSLQGDFVLDAVRLHESPDVPDVCWIHDLNPKKTMPFAHYEHMNLYLHSPNAVDWSFTMPANVQSAEFHTAVALAKRSAAATGPADIPGATSGAPQIGSHDGATLKIFLEPSNHITSSSAQPIYTKRVTRKGTWIPVHLSLSHLAGKSVTLRLTSDGGADGTDDHIVLQYPKIDVTIDKSKTLQPPPLIDLMPSNTELSPRFPRHLQEVYALPPLTDSHWRPEDFEVAAPGAENSSSPLFSKVFSASVFRPDQPILLRNYSHLRFTMSAPPDRRGRALKCVIVLESGKTVQFSLPLLPDPKTHQYVYDLKLLELKQKDALQQLIVHPIAMGSGAGIKLDSVSLIKAR